MSEFLPCTLPTTSQNPPLYYQLLIVHLLDGDHHLFLYTLPQLEVIFIPVFGNRTTRREGKKVRKKTALIDILVAHNRNQRKQQFTSLSE